MQFAIVRFIDGKTKFLKIAPVKLIKKPDGEPFRPDSAKAFDAAAVYGVQWQHPSEDWDGFCEANIVGLAASEKSATLKAVQLGLKLPPNPLLVLDDQDEGVSNDQPGPDNAAEDAGSRDCRKRRSSNGPQGVVVPSTSQQSDHPQPKKPNLGGSKPRAKVSKQGNQCIQTKGRQPTNKMANDAASANRLQDALASARSNPLFSMEVQQTAEKTSSTGKSDSESPINPLLTRKDQEESRRNSVTAEKTSSTGKSDSEPPINRLLTREDEEESRRNSVVSNNSSFGSRPFGFQDLDSSEDDMTALARDRTNLLARVKELERDLEIQKASLRVVEGTRKRLSHELSALQVKYQQRGEELRKLSSLVDYIHKKTGRENLSTGPSGAAVEAAQPHAGSAEDRELPAPSVDVSTPSRKKGLLIPTSPAVTTPSQRKGFRDNVSDIDLVKQNVLNHLNGNQLPMNGDELEIGLGVKINAEALTTNFTSYGSDFKKFTKHLTTLLWSDFERMVRSLNGQKNNRFKECEAKRAASPQKVHAILGIVKAAMVSGGHSEGEMMTIALKECRAAIGSKFNQAATKVKRQPPAAVMEPAAATID